MLIYLFFWGLPWLTQIRYELMSVSNEHVHFLKGRCPSHKTRPSSAVFVIAVGSGEALSWSEGRSCKKNTKTLSMWICLVKTRNRILWLLWRGKNCCIGIHMELLVCDIYQLPCVIWYQECVHRENIWLLHTFRFQVTVKCKYELIFFQNTDECVSKTKKTSETKWYRKRSYEGDIVALTCCVSLWKQCHQFLSGAREAHRKPEKRNLTTSTNEWNEVPDVRRVTA